MHECPICLEKISIFRKVKTECNHNFHNSCLTCWLLNNNTCPVCRTVIKYFNGKYNNIDVKIEIENTNLIVTNEKTVNFCLPYYNIQTIYMKKKEKKIIICTFNNRIKKYEKLNLFLIHFKDFFYCLKKKISSIYIQHQNLSNEIFNLNNLS